jgi:hypothetical protein
MALERSRGEVGLCAMCTHVHIVQNRRGSRFYRCRLAEADPSFPRYPALPVLVCRGYEPAEEVPEVTPE